MELLFGTDIFPRRQYRIQMALFWRSGIQWLMRVSWTSIQRSRFVVAATAVIFGAGELGCGRSGTHDARSMTAAPADAGASLQTDGGGVGAVGYDEDGPYRCCAPDAGTSCCVGTKTGFCFEYGGIYKTCTGPGQQYEGKVICARCCPGLARTTIVHPGDAVPSSVDGLPDGCDEGDEPGGLGVCIACGDGACGPGENFCNCPADCPRP
jgi:hypothetical protein